jgi:hypothetical protein
MARNAAEQHPEIDARQHWLVRPNRNGGKTDVVGVVSSSTPRLPPPSKAMLNLRGKP